MFTFFIKVAIGILFLSPRTRKRLPGFCQQLRLRGVFLIDGEL